jgi:molecular chaperone DnaJ
MKDYYNILEISESSGPADIKSAYKKLAIKWHPDKNNGSKESEERFKEVAEAYEILSDQKKRIIYDNSRKSNNYNNSNNNEEFNTNFRDPHDFFSSFFNKKTTSEKRREANYNLKYKKEDGSNIEINNIDVSLSEIKGGKRKYIVYKRKVKCSCFYEGDICCDCNGSGTIVQKINTIIGYVKKEEKCTTCVGTGKNSNCYICSNNRFVISDTKLNYTVPKTAHISKRVIIKGYGNQDLGENGNLILNLVVEEETNYSLEGNDITHDIEIGFVDAIFGGNLTINVLNGFVEFMLPPNSIGKTMRIKGHGLNGGNMLINCLVKIPDLKSLSRDEKEILFELNKYENFK